MRGKKLEGFSVSERSPCVPGGKFLLPAILHPVGLHQRAILLGWSCASSRHSHLTETHYRKSPAVLPKLALLLLSQTIETHIVQKLPGLSVLASHCCLDCFLLPSLAQKCGEHHWRAHKLFEGA